MIALNGQTFEHIRKAVIRYDGTVLRGRAENVFCQKDESIMDNPKLPAVKIKPKIAPWDLPVRIEPS